MAYIELHTNRTQHFKTAVRKLHKCIQSRMCVRQWIAQWALQQAGENRRKMRQAGTDAQPLQLQSAEDLKRYRCFQLHCDYPQIREEWHNGQLSGIINEPCYANTVWCYTQQNDCIILLQIATSNWTTNQNTETWVTGLSSLACLNQALAFMYGDEDLKFVVKQ